MLRGPEGPLCSVAREDVDCRGRGERLPLRNVTRPRPESWWPSWGRTGLARQRCCPLLVGSADPGRVVSGAVLVNGCPMDAPQFRQVSRHVPGDYALFLMLTVKELLLYCAGARLRLHAMMGDAEARARELMAELKPWHVGNSSVIRG